MKCLIAALSAAALCAAPAMAQDSVEALQDSFVTAIMAEDAEAIGELYAEDAVNYSVGVNYLVGPKRLPPTGRAFLQRSTILN